MFQSICWCRNPNIALDEAWRRTEGEAAKTNGLDATQDTRSNSSVRNYCLWTRTKSIWIFGLIFVKDRFPDQNPRTLRKTLSTLIESGSFDQKTKNLTMVLLSSVFKHREGGESSYNSLFETEKSINIMLHLRRNFLVFDDILPSIFRSIFEPILWSEHRRQRMRPLSSGLKIENKI